MCNIADFIKAKYAILPGQQSLVMFSVVMLIKWDCTTMFAFFWPHRPLPSPWLMFTPVVSGTGYVWGRPNHSPRCQGPVSTSTAVQRSARTDGYNDLTRQRNTLLIQMTSAMSSVHLRGLTKRSRTEEEDDFVVICPPATPPRCCGWTHIAAPHWNKKPRKSL